MVLCNKRRYYKRVVVTATAYPSTPQIDIPFTANHIVIVPSLCDDDQTLLMSFQPSITPPDDLDGEFYQHDAALIIDETADNKIWFKRLNTDSAVEVRVWAWPSFG